MDPAEEKTPILGYAETPDGGAYGRGYVWGTGLDKRYIVEVHRTGDYNGDLLVWDTENDNALILDEPVGLAYGARFGADGDDVAHWQERVIAVVDGGE